MRFDVGDVGHLVIEYVIKCNVYCILRMVLEESSIRVSCLYRQTPFISFSVCFFSY